MCARVDDVLEILLQSLFGEAVSAQREPPRPRASSSRHCRLSAFHRQKHRYGCRQPTRRAHGAASAMAATLPTGWWLGRNKLDEGAKRGVSDADRDRTRRAGFESHINKPFDQATIVAAFGAVISRRLMEFHVPRLPRGSH